MRRVEADGASVSYVNAGSAPAYWGGYGLGPGLFAGFLLGQAFAPYGGFADGYSSGDGDDGGGDYAGGDFGGGDFGAGDFGGGTSSNCRLYGGRFGPVAPSQPR